MKELCILDIFFFINPIKRIKIQPLSKITPVFVFILCHMVHESFLVDFHISTTSLLYVDKSYLQCVNFCFRWAVVESLFSYFFLLLCQ